MSRIKKAVIELQDDVEEIKDKVKSINKNIDKADEKFLRSSCIEVCEGCGCLLCTDKAIKGKSVVAKRKEYIRSPYGPDYEYEEEYIRKTWYCRRCAPKPNAKKGKK